MTRIHLETSYRSLLADTLTPVQAFMRVRDLFPRPLLLESADYRGTDNSMSYICCDPLATLTINEGIVREDGRTLPFREYSCAEAGGLAAVLDDFRLRFELGGNRLPNQIRNGLFGYVGYDGVQHMEEIRFSSPLGNLAKVPEVRFGVYRFILAIDHFKSEMTILENRVAGDSPSMNIDEFLHTLFTKHVVSYPFELRGGERDTMSDTEFADVIRTCQRHIRRGDVFQIVPSRRFQQDFTGDDFAVYRILRSVNPSPFLFYFDQGDFSIFGSSPEAQIVVSNGKAGIYPIAGTYPRSGNDEIDAKRAEELLSDPKENSEHAMLVDLARNDLSRSCTNVRVEKLKEIQFYSHVIHLVSKVVGTLEGKRSIGQVISETFPAGTLSGAPKYRAMELIDANEPVRRQLYGGCLGLIDFEGNALLAIMIRTFVSRANTLSYQAGAGITINSVPEREVAEVNHKIGALRAAIKRAKEVHK